MGSEIVATHSVNGQAVVVYGCWDEDTPDEQYDFYDIYNTAGDCLNIGEPFYDVPSPLMILEFLNAA